MVSSFMYAFIKTKNKLLLRHYHNIKFGKHSQLQLQLQFGGGGVMLDGFIFKETHEEDENGKILAIQIFIGGYNDCLIAVINTDEPETVYLQYFAYNTHCNVNGDLLRDSGTTEMMNTFIKYILEKHFSVSVIKLSDDASFKCDDITINLYKLYMLKYGLSYYEKKFDFQIDTIENKEKILAIHNYNKDVFTKGIKLDKDLIRIELGRIKMLDGYKYDSDNINNFLDNMGYNELVSEFLTRYHAKINECEIFNDMLDIVFNLYMTQLPTSIVFFKVIRNNYNYKSMTLEPKRKLTRKSVIKVSKKLTRKISNSK